MALRDPVASAVAAVESNSAARPFTVAIGLDGPGRTATLIFPLDVSDAELLWVAGQVAINARKAVMAQRAQDQAKGLVVAHSLPRPS